MEPAGVVLIGPGRTVLAMNSLAAQLWDSEDSRVLRTLLTDENSGALDGRLMRVDCPSGRTPYLAWITHLVDGASAPPYRVMTIYDPDRCAEISRASLLAAYRFTRAEMRLVEQLLLGRTPIEAAEALGVTIHTVRTYLKRLYHKVGVRSQATLVRRLVQVSSTVTPALCAGSPGD